MALKLNPFAGLPNPKTVWAWGMYDLANQSFTLLVNTLLFAVYFKEVVVVDDPKRGTSLWGLVFAASMLLVVIFSPLLGALADSRGLRKAILIGTGVCCASLTIALGATGPGLIALAIILYIPANFCYQIGENFLASFLPSISTPKNIGRVSATGWAMGYVGALCLLVLTIGGMMLLDMGDREAWRPFFVMAGVWFLIIMSPAVVVLREPPVVRSSDQSSSVVADTVNRLKQTLRSAGQFTQLVRFLIAFFVFGMGVQVVIAFAAIIAGDFGVTGTGLAVFVLQITVTAGAAAIATGFFQDRIGVKATVLIYLLVWMISTAGLLLISLIPDCPQWAFWVVGNGVGFGMGGIGTASRSMVGKFAPAHKTAEFFGLWGMVYKSAGVVGAASFSQVNAWIGMQASLGLLLGFFAVGLVLTLRVRELAGVRAARRAERETALSR